jgi:hypothetical protein
LPSVGVSTFTFDVPAGLSLEFAVAESRDGSSPTAVEARPGAFDVIVTTTPSHPGPVLPALVRLRATIGDPSAGATSSSIVKWRAWTGWNATAAAAGGERTAHCEPDGPPVVLATTEIVIKVNPPPQ